MNSPSASTETPRDLWPKKSLDSAARRDSFVALLAHEIRNPLAPIRSGVALLQSDRVNEQVRTQTLAMMERQLSHLVRLVDDLLASVSVRGGEMLASAERVRLADVLSAALDSARPAILAKQQTIRLSGNETGATVEADPRRLAQAFSNLLNTSSKKTPWDGRLVVDVVIADDVAEIRFSDSGIGIPPGELVDLFELYGRSSAAIGEGLGIGLALVRGLVEMNGGTVEAIESANEAGTVFVVRIPARHGEASDRDRGAATAPAPTAWRSRRILVVDDNRDAAQTLGVLLELDGHTVRLAHDGPAAVAETREFSPEVVLMDIGLPGYDGLVATREIRRLELPSRPMVVALTGWGSTADRAATHDAGCDLHLVKPIDYREIARTLALSRAKLKEAQ